MINFTGKPVIYVHSGDINMGKSFKGLTMIIEEKLRRKPSDNEVFVFFNHARTKVKIMFYHFNGFVIVYKALDHEIFELEYKDGMRKVKNINATKLLEDIHTSKVLKR